jgi:hypothetical protein
MGRQTLAAKPKQGKEFSPRSDVPSQQLLDKLAINPISANPISALLRDN